MKISVRLLLLPTLLAFSSALFAQKHTYSIQQIQFEDGLLHRVVSTVYQDRKGLIWLGSPSGLQQFDGHEFKAWFDNEASGKKISISKIGEDDKNWLWLWNTASNQFLFFNTVTEKTQTVQERFGSNFPIKNYQNQSGWTYLGDRIPTDSKNRLCFVSSSPNKVYYYHSAQGFTSHLLPSLTAKTIELKHFGKDNSLWVVEKHAKRRLVKLTAEGKELADYEFPENFILTNFSERNGSIYFTASNSTIQIFYEINSRGEQIPLYTKPEKSDDMRIYLSHIWDFSPKIWRIYDKQELGPLFQIEIGDNYRNMYPSDAEVYEDRKGRVWFYGEYGLSVVSSTENVFVNYFSLDKTQKGTLKNSSRGIAADSSNLYVNFEYYGLFKFTKNQPKEAQLLSTSLDEYPYLGRPLVFKDNTTLCSVHEKGLYEFDLRRGAYIKAASESKNSSTSAVWSIYKVGGNVWVGREFDLAKWNSSLQIYESIKLKDKSGKIVEIGGVLQFERYSPNLTWLCTNKGLLLVDLDKNLLIAQYGVYNKDKHHLPAQVFYSLHRDKQNVYWLGTNAGLIRWERKKNEYRVFTKLTGLSNNTIYSVLEDDYNCLWLGSDYGLMRLNKADFNVTIYLKKDGIADNEFNRISYLKDKDGTMYFGGINGITSFHPKEFINKIKKNNQSLFITEFQVYDKGIGSLVWKTGEVRQKSKLIIYPTYKYIRLKFSIPNYEDDYLNTYAWKLGSRNDEWIIQTSNQLQFDKLPYGNHILYIKGRNAGGNWSDPLQIKLQIIKPFYLQTWFLLSLILALVSAITYAWRRRAGMLKRQAAILQAKITEATQKIEEDKNLIAQQAEELRTLDEAKSQFYANASHELRTPLTLVLGPLQNVLANTSEGLSPKVKSMLELSMKNSLNLQNRVNEILDLSKIDAGKLSLTLVPVNLFSAMNQIIQSFTVLAQNRNIALDFVSDISEDLHLYLDSVKFEKVIANLLSNALKYTPKNGQILVKVFKSGELYNIQVQDSGQGISQEEAAKIFERYYQIAGPQNTGGTGIGLSLSRELAKIMGGDISLLNTDRKGATFLFQFKAKLCDDLADLSSSKLDPPAFRDEAQKHKQTAHANSVILVVEDNAEMRFFIREILKDNYTILEAADGVEALEVLKNSKVDLITCDVMMPNIDGIRFVNELKKLPNIGNTPVIMLSAKSQLDDKLAILRLGVDDYLVKPFYSSELLVRIENLLANKDVRESISSSMDLSQVASAESLWLEKVRSCIASNIANPLFSVADLCDAINMHERTLNRNLQKEIGHSAALFIKEVRLNRAMEGLLKRDYRSIKEASIAAGFQRPDYFSKEFYKRFGKMPSDFF